MIPSRSFFLYLNIDFVPAAWSAYRGQLITPSNYGTVDFRPLSYWPVRLLRERHVSRMQKELMLEQVRRQFYPAAVSRLQGIYLWEDEQSAKRGERWRDTEGSHFHPDYLVEVGFTYSQLSRVDTNWIDKYLLPDSMSPERNADWMYKYWAGEACPGDEPLWECIAEGRGLIYGTSIRMQAYEKVAAAAPESLGQLELGRIALEMGSNLYHSMPFILSTGNGGFHVSYYLDTNDHNHDFMVRAGRFIKEVAEKDRSHINWDALNFLRGDTKVPDLRTLGFTFNCQEFHIDEQTLIDGVVSRHNGSTWLGATELPGANLVPKHPGTP
ncbi:MAG: hypothetical protein ABL950_08570 [Nitrospira sp.]